MTYFQKKLEELKIEIEQVTTSVLEQLESGDVDDISSLLTKRSNLFSELISISANEISKGETLREYLIELQRRDQVIMESISHKKTEIQNTISNFNKLDKYFNV